MRTILGVMVVCGSLAGQTELLGPGALVTSRSQQIERGDGTGQYLEVFFNVQLGGPGASNVELWTSKRDAGKYTRVKLSTQQVPIADFVRVAKETYDFPYPLYTGGNAATAENRMVALYGTTDFAVRTVNLVTQAVGRAVSVPGQARTVALRSGADEAWTLHATPGAAQIVIVDLRNERISSNIALNLTGTATPVGLYLSSSGRTAYVLVRNADTQTNDRGTVLAFDAVTRQRKSVTSLGTMVPVGGVLSPDGSTLYVTGTAPNDAGTAQAAVGAYDAASATFSVGGFVTTATDQVVAHPNGLRLYWLQPTTSSVEEYDVQARAVVRRYQFARAVNPVAIDISPTGDVISVRDSAASESHHIDTGTLGLLATIPVGTGVSVMLVRP